MGQCAIALDNFQEPKHNSRHHARPAEVQFPQVAAVSGSSVKIGYHTFKRLFRVVNTDQSKFLEFTVAFNERVHEALDGSRAHIVIN